jgi:predicted site-specific integrase-resolvase
VSQTAEVRRETTDIMTAAQRLGISRSLAYQLARTGWLVEGSVPVLRAGSDRYVVPTAALDRALGQDAA